MDEDTGEVVSIERNEVILDRETELESDHIDLIMDSGTKQSCSIKKTLMQRITPSSTIHFKKTLLTLKLKR